jgi:hypothetical protein
MNGRNWRQSGVVAGYHLEDVNDFSGNARDLSNNGSVTFNTTKYDNGAILGNSNSSKCLSRSDALGVDMSGDHGCSIWIHLQTNPSVGYQCRAIDWRSTSGTARWFIWDYKNNGGTYQIVWNPNTFSSIGFNYTLNLNTWYKLDISMSGSNAYMYMNGVLIRTDTRGTYSNVSNCLVLGAELTRTAGYFWKGNLDEAIFFNRHRTESEIKRVYAIDVGLI